MQVVTLANGICKSSNLHFSPPQEPSIQNGDHKFFRTKKSLEKKQAILLPGSLKPLNP